MLKKLAMLAAVAAIVALPLSAAAQVELGVGARFAWDNYSTAIANTSHVQAESDGNVLNGSSMGGEFHLMPIKQLQIVASMDMGVFTQTTYPFVIDDKTEQEIKTSFFKFGIMAGAKFYIKEPKPRSASLYVSAGIGKYFSKAKETHYDTLAMIPDPTLEQETQDRLIKEAEEAELKIASKLASPFFFQLAVGAEFFANEVFSIGADILGMRFSFAKVDVGEQEYAINPEFGSGEVKNNQFYVYSALTINFNLSADGSGAAAPVADVEEGKAKAEGKGGWGGGWGSSATPPAAPAPAPVPAPAPPPPANDGWGAPAPAPGGGGGWDEFSPSEPPPPPPPSY